VQLDPVNSELKAPGIILMKLRCDGPLSDVAFKFKLRRYIEVRAVVRAMPLEDGYASTSRNGIRSRSWVGPPPLLPLNLSVMYRYAFVRRSKPYSNPPI
jgi:hypothetical protein